jgi:heme/copper-type cytochrome/quinol oxidase subunit 4
MFGNVWITLLTAFGIAFVKAGMVGAYFMHLNTEAKYVWYLLFTMLLLMGLLFMGVVPDVMMHTGNNWTNRASVRLVEHYRTSPAGGEHHQPAGEEHH